ncbi:MarR family winged helix-turn-helix transcriptional regulator [Paenarthrobacter sp. NPDC056912]|uniref:MarR family winged helix-turn-helix transcriptional regulator n=1 Tax=Paenarthrobacter sp. NPDC056912 TaxID=3345965 RepID=UPI00366D7611
MDDEPQLILLQLSGLLSAAAALVEEEWAKGLAGLGISVASVAILEALTVSGRTTPTALARRMRIRADSLSSLLGKLEKGGYVRRHVRESAGASATVVITGSGLTLVQTTRQLESAILARVTANASALREDLQAIVSALG